MQPGKENPEMSDKEVYTQFVQWLRKTWWGLPESEHLMPTIMTFYTPEEAVLLTGIPFSGNSLEELAEMKGMEPDDLAPNLDALARRGAVWRRVKGDTVRYSLNDSFFVFLRGPFWAADPDEATKAAAAPLNKYFFDGFMDQFAHAHTKGLRTIPIDKTVEDPRRILPYEDVVRYLDSQDYCTVSYCPCRQRKNLDPDSPNCSHPVEVCLHFNALGHYIVENGLGREITKEETKAILKQAADSGLVHAISNWQQGADTICNCCNCCCLFMDAYHVLKHHKSHDVSNYRVRTTPETCKACGLCVKRCPVDALQLKISARATNKHRKAVVVDESLCIGCGVCVHKCPTESLILERREETSDPPRDVREWMDRWTVDQKAAPSSKE
jgi:formate hydrogenlyase subunit 6/NADH:ubiquinone oxidoreductase subunit I